MKLPGLAAAKTTICGMKLMANRKIRERAWARDGTS